MKKKVALPLLAIVLIGVIASHISFKSADHSHLMVVDGIEIDVLGKYKINGWHTLKIVMACHNRKLAEKAFKLSKSQFNLIVRRNPNLRK